MTFKIKWDPKAVKQLEKLPKDVAKRIVEKLRLVGLTGRFVEFLTDHEFGHKIRAGDYRILIDISYEMDEIFVRYVGHRKNVYKKR